MTYACHELHIMSDTQLVGHVLLAITKQHDVTRSGNVDGTNS